MNNAPNEAKTRSTMLKARLILVTSEPSPFLAMQRMDSAIKSPSSTEVEIRKIRKRR